MFENIDNMTKYVYSFFVNENDDIFKDIDFDKSSCYTILDEIKIIKQKTDPINVYRTKIYYEELFKKDVKNKLNKLKYIIILFFDSSFDKSLNILEHLNNYKGLPNCKKCKAHSYIEEFKLNTNNLKNLEDRYKKLIKKDTSNQTIIETDNESSDNETSDNESDNENALKIKIKSKAKIAILQ